MANKNCSVGASGKCIAVVANQDNMKVVPALVVMSMCALVQALVDNVRGEKITSEIRFFNDSETNFNPRIIGGISVAPNDYPFQAVVQATSTGSTAFCGGTLVAPEWILTAAHCVDNKPSSITVILGAHNLSDPTERNRQIYRTTTYKIHQGWNETALRNDIALIKLPRKATLNSFVGTIRLASGNENFQGRMGTTLGWGTIETGYASNTLMSVDTPILSNKYCRSIGSYNQVITSSHLCVSGISETGPRGSCSGDSGGPLLVSGIQVGIVSFGPENCSRSLPSVFTRISEFDKWIQTTTSGATQTITSIATSYKICKIVLFIVSAGFWLI